MAACPDLRYDTAAMAYQSLLEADAGGRALRLHPCGGCRGWHLTPRRVTRAQWLSRRRHADCAQTRLTA